MVEMCLTASASEPTESNGTADSPHAAAAGADQATDCLVPAAAGVDSDQQCPPHETSLQRMMWRRARQEARVYRETMEQIRRSNRDLLQMRDQKQTMEVPHSQPWSPELKGQDLLLMDDDAWQQYVQKYLFTSPAVQLPPEEEVNIDLLTARRTGVQKMRPAPGRTCFCGFYPPFGRSVLQYNQSRSRRLVPGARIPNSIIIRILWSTRTLLDVEFYRRQENERNLRRQLWERLEWSDAEAPAAAVSVDSLEAIAARRRHRHKVALLDNEHIENWLDIDGHRADDASLDSEDEAIQHVRALGVTPRGRLLTEEGLPVQTGGGSARDRRPVAADAAPRRSDDETAAHVEANQGEGTLQEQRADAGSGGSSRRGERRSAGAKTASPRGAEARSRSEGVEENAAKPSKIAREQNAIGERTDAPHATVPARTTYPASEQHGAATGPNLGGSPLQTAEGVTAGRTPADTQSHRSYPGDQLMTDASHRVPAVAAAAADGARTGGRPEQEHPHPQYEPPSRAQTRSSAQPGHEASGGSPPWKSPGTGPTEQAYLPERPGRVPLTERARSERAGQDRGETDQLNADRPNEEYVMQMPHCYEIKDYVCEDSNSSSDAIAEGFHDARRLFDHRKSKQRKGLRKPDHEGDAAHGLVIEAHGFQGQHAGSHRSSDVLRDASPEVDESSGTRMNPVCVRETDSESHEREAGGDDLKVRGMSIASESPRDAAEDSYSGSLNEAAREYMEHLLTQQWICNLIPEVNKETLGPWDVIDHLLRHVSKQPGDMKIIALNEIQNIFKQFSHRNVEGLSHEILEMLYANNDDLSIVETILNTLECIGVQMDAVVTGVLSLLAVVPEDVAEGLLLFLGRLGLVDPGRLVQAQALSWAPKRRRHTDPQLLRKVLLRKALNFVSVWGESFEAHSKLIAKEINKRKMDAIVKYNIIKILHSYEPQAVNETPEGISVTLKNPVSDDGLRNPETIEILNYFVEMTDDEDSEELGSSRLTWMDETIITSDPLKWRKSNKDILVPPSQSSTMQGNRPLRSGLQWPTSLVTHHPSRPELAPLPWPSVVVGMQLRIADKYYRTAPRLPT